MTLSVVKNHLLPNLVIIKTFFGIFEVILMELSHHKIWSFEHPKSFSLHTNQPDPKDCSHFEVCNREVQTTATQSRQLSLSVFLKSFKGIITSLYDVLSTQNPFPSTQINQTQRTVRILKRVIEKFKHLPHSHDNHISLKVVIVSWPPHPIYPSLAAAAVWG